MLSGLITMGRGCPAVPVTTGKPEAPGPSSSRTKRPLPSKSYTSSRYYRTVSRRTEPSSCGPLMDEQPNPWWLLHHQDGPSRQRCTKPRGRFVQTLQKSSFFSVNAFLSYKKEKGLCTLARDEPVKGFVQRYFKSANTFSFCGSSEPIKRLNLIKFVFDRIGRIKTSREVVIFPHFIPTAVKILEITCNTAFDF